MNKRILITGASSDVGLEVTKLLLASGNTVIGTFNTSSNDLENIAAASSGKLILKKCNLAEGSEVEGLAQQLKTDGVPDGIVHLAAPSVSQVRFTKTVWNDFQLDIDIQLKSLHHILITLMPGMATRGSGNIVLMLSSYTLNVPPAAMVHYTTVKYAMLGFMKSLASEYRSKGIRINAVSPSMIKTKFLKNIPAISVEMAEAAHPMKRIAVPHDVAPAILFLLSDDSKFINGVNVPISGGEVF